MPWQPDGSFLRVNPDFSGTDVWSQDQQVPIKIVATRHDFHDEDLAVGISRALNIDGVNAMLTDLDVGNFKLINVDTGVNPSDGVRLDQLISTASFDNPSRNLTLGIDNGSDLVVNIPSGSGGGGEGSVTSVSAGDGLAGAPNPITTSGQISLETLGAEQTYNGGVETITVDKHGRVTQVVTGSSPNTNLGLGTITTETVEVTSSTGSNVVIPAATDSAAGLMSAAEHATLGDITDLGGYKGANFTPTGPFTEAGGGLNTGRYIQIGQAIFVWIHYEWTAGLTGSTSFQLGGLPATVGENGETGAEKGLYKAFYCGIGPDNIYSDVNDAQSIAATFLRGTKTLRVTGMTASNTSPGGVPAQTVKELTYDDFPASGWISIVGCYRTNNA